MSAHDSRAGRFGPPPPILTEKLSKIIAIAWHRLNEDFLGYKGSELKTLLEDHDYESEYKRIMGTL